jgi:DNA-binding transcriptional LysR family regulator
VNRPIDSRQLLAFAAVAQCQSFTRAAKQLYLTQGAVSHAIKALETEVGTRLVDRSGRRILLTPAGEQFLAHADRILREMDTARAGIDALGRWGHGRLRIGASTTACQYLLPTILREFRASYPKAAITIQPGDHRRQLEMLHHRHTDLALMLEPERVAEFEFVPLFTDELRFITASGHAWARAGRAQVQDLATETLVLYTQSSHTFRLITDYFRTERIAIGHFIELGSMEAIKELVKSGVGIGVLAPWIARAELESGALASLPLGRKRLRRTWGVASLKGRRLQPGEDAFVGLARSIIEQLRVGQD